MMRDFVVESNRIEGILREPTDAEVSAHAAFLAAPKITLDHVCGFVAVVAGAELRNKRGMNVRVGGHYPPPGGPHIEEQLAALLGDVVAHTGGPFITHLRYEQLHPFMDGNGRSGRVLWAWQMLREGLDPFSLPFLHRFYYQTLSASPQQEPSQ